MQQRDNQAPQPKHEEPKPKKAQRRRKLKIKQPEPQIPQNLVDQFSIEIERDSVQHQEEHEPRFLHFEDVSVEDMFNQSSREIKLSTENIPLNGQRKIQNIDLFIDLPTKRQVKRETLNKNDSDEEFQYEQDSFQSENFYRGKPRYMPKLQKKHKRNYDHSNRKIRRTITYEKLTQLNQLFKIYHRQQNQTIKRGKKVISGINLKNIAKDLDLGYSTVMHKYRYFKKNMEVKGGLLLQSSQLKRQYTKSFQIQKDIKKALSQKSFNSAVELGNYLRQKHGKSYSRSVISRHIATLGFSLNNATYHEKTINDKPHLQIRQVYCAMIDFLKRRGKQFIYIDEFAYSLKMFLKQKVISQQRQSSFYQNTYVSVLIAADCQSILFYDVVNGFFTRERFMQLIGQLDLRISQIRRRRGNTNYNPVMLTDMNPIHRDDRSKNISVSDIIASLGIDRYFLPPSSPGLNPLTVLFQNILNRGGKEVTIDQWSLKKKLQDLMQTLSTQSTQVYFKHLRKYMNYAIQGMPLPQFIELEQSKEKQQKVSQSVAIKSQNNAYQQEKIESEA